MNKKILAGLVVASLSTSVFADTATSGHDLGVTVPSVALMTVDQAAVAFALTAPTTAGTNFDVSAESQDSSYAITTNVLKDGSTSRSISAKVSAVDTVFDVLATVAAPTTGTSAGVITLTATDQAVVTGITNVAATGLVITYGLDLKTTGTAVPPNGAYPITVTYTLGAEGA